MWRSASIRSESFLALFLVLLLIAAAGCGGESSGAPGADDEGGDAATAEAAAGEDKGEEQQKEEEQRKKKRKEQSTSVTVSPVQRGDLVIPVVAEGSIRARHAAELEFEISGRVTRVWIEEGQRVRRGQKLIGLDDREYRLALEEANSRYLQGLGQLAVEEEGYDSQGAERLLSEKTAELNRKERAGEITHDERLDRELRLGMEAVRDGAYRRELMEVRSGLAAARADAARLELNLERAILKAPFSGVITDLDLNPGERIQSGETVCRLVDQINIEADVGVLESDLGSIEVGRPAWLTIPALGETIPVRVDVVSPDIDTASRTCSVRLRFKSDRGRVKPGMFVRAAIAGRVLGDRVMVPREAILTRDGRPVVFRVEGDRAKWVYVKLGERNEHLVEIVRVEQGGPLDAGTLVVVDNHLTLTHEAKIKVKKTLDPADPWTVSPEKG
jgi:RND family efflux transporter MFP subunit